jgi:hypothetical protein
MSGPLLPLRQSAHRRASCINVVCFKPLTRNLRPAGERLALFGPLDHGSQADRDAIEQHFVWQRTASAAAQCRVPAPAAPSMLRPWAPLRPSLQLSIPRARGHHAAQQRGHFHGKPAELAQLCSSRPGTSCSRGPRRPALPGPRYQSCGAGGGAAATHPWSWSSAPSAAAAAGSTQRRRRSWARAPPELGWPAHQQQQRQRRQRRRQHALGTTHCGISRTGGVDNIIAPPAQAQPASAAAACSGCSSRRRGWPSRPVAGQRHQPASCRRWQVAAAGGTAGWRMAAGPRLAGLALPRRPAAAGAAAAGPRHWPAAAGA